MRVVVIMVKRGGKEVYTVEIDKKNYDGIKKKAVQENSTVKEFINRILDRELKKEKLLEYSEIQLIGSAGVDTVVLRERKTKQNIDITVGKGTLYCNSCKSKECIHTQLALLIPKVVDSMIDKFYSVD